MALGLFQSSKQGAQRPHAFNLQITPGKHLVSKESLKCPDTSKMNK